MFWSSNCNCENIKNKYSCTIYNQNPYQRTSTTSQFPRQVENGSEIYIRKGDLNAIYGKSEDVYKERHIEQGNSLLRSIDYYHTLGLGQKIALELFQL